METTVSTGTLQRKLQAGQDDPPSGGRAALRALRLGLARAALDVFDLPVSVIGATQARIAQSMISEHLADDQLLVLLDGPDRNIGAMSLDRNCVAALIQQQTMGLVVDIEPAARAYTGTDAAMAAPLIDTTMEKAAALTDSAPDRQCLEGYRFGARARDARSLLLSLEADRLRLFHLTLEFSGGVRQGQVVLILPDIAVHEDAATNHGTRTGMANSIATARADLSVVIDRLSVPLAELSSLRVGDCLPLPKMRLNEAELVAIDGDGVGAVRLGQSGGLRAIRLNETAAPVTEGDAEAGGGAFKPSALPQPSPPTDGEQGQTNQPSLIDAAVTWLEEDESAGSDNSISDEATQNPADDPLPVMSVEDAAAEISQLAGLPLDEELTPAKQPDNT